MVSYRQYFRLLFYLFIFKVSFCGKKSSQSNKEGWENRGTETSFSFFSPKVQGLEGRGHSRSSHHSRGNRADQEPRKAGDLGPGAAGSAPKPKMSPWPGIQWEEPTLPPSSPRLLRPAPGTGSRLPHLENGRRALLSQWAQDVLRKQPAWVWFSLKFYEQAEEKQNIVLLLFLSSFRRSFSWQAGDVRQGRAPGTS